MNKTQFVEAVAKKAELNKKEAEAAVNAMMAVVADELKAGNKVQLIGFGNFEVKDVAAREGRNPKTGEVVSVPACKYLAFVSAKAIKENLN